MNEREFMNEIESSYNNPGKIASLLSERKATTEKEKISRAKNDMRAIAANADGERKEFITMIAELLNFAEDDRPLKDWKAAQAALRNYTRNY